MSSAGDILLKAASLVEEGWCQYWPYAFYDDGHARIKARCAFAAILDAGAQPRGVPFFPVEVLPEVSEATARLEREIGGGIVPWNDAAGRTKEEVADAMRRAALRQA